MQIDKPEMMLLYIPIIILLAVLLAISFVKFEKEEKRSTIIYRILLFLSRAIIFGFLVFALTSPYIIKKETTAGNPEINILYDNSSSMGLFDANTFELKKKLEKEIPTNIKMIGSGTTSMLGDEIFRELHKKNILLITDGNNNEKSMDFKDIITFAKKFNTTINAIRLEEVNPDASIEIKGPYSSIVDTDYVFNVYLRNANKPVQVRVKVAGQVVYSKETDEQEIQIKQKFTKVGSYKIEAEILTEDKDDKYDINNHYYHVVDVVEKPKVLYLSDKTSYIDSILYARYNTQKTSTLPNDLSPYYSVVINDKMDDISYEQGKLLESFTDDGNGLIVIGGETSFLTNSNIDLLLPVKKGYMEEVGVDFNFLFLLDGSGYISEKMTREEKVTNDILNYFIYRKEPIHIAVVMFAHIGDVISDWKPKQQKDGIVKLMIDHKDINEIGGIKWYRPAQLDIGLKQADKMFAGMQGNNNIIVISDGAISEKIFTPAVEYIKSLRNKGIRVHSYNLKNDEYDDSPLKKTRQAISTFGRGMFIESPEEANNLFEKNLIISNPTHWITQGLTISASLYKYNSVVPTASADVLVTTGTGIPIVSVNNYNKVGVISTDDGKEWAQDMYLPKNIFLIYRVMDWGVGDPNRKKDTYVRVIDAIINKETKVEYKGKTAPTSSECNFYVVEDYYECIIVPTSVGFGTILGKEFGVNYDLEYRDVGFNENEIEQMTKETGGSIFNPTDYSNIIKKAKDKAKVEVMTKQYIDWYFVIAAMVLFLIEVLIRRIKEKIKNG